MPASNKEPLVALEGVTLKRGHRTILEDVDFQVRSGENWVVLGPNGAGKTTLAAVASARDYPTTGSAKVMGEETSHQEPTYVGSKVGVSSQEVRDRIDGGETVEGAVLSAAWGQTSRFDDRYEDQDRARAQDLLAALGLVDMGERRFATLSEGEKQRVSIARALMADPEVIILDEPTAGLDLGARETLVDALQEIMTGPGAPSVLMITHEIEEIAPGFTHAAVMKDGRVVAAGPIEETLSEPVLSDAFGLPLQVTREGGRWWARAR